MVKIGSLSAAVLKNHMTKCRCCLKAFGNTKRQHKITKTVEIRYFELTNLEVNEYSEEVLNLNKKPSIKTLSFQLKVLPEYSNTICDSCNEELKRISEFRAQIIFKQTCLQNHVDSKVECQEFVTVKVEPEVEAAFMEENLFDPVVAETEVFEDLVQGEIE
jgi:hypothetical protein